MQRWRNWSLPQGERISQTAHVCFEAFLRKAARYTSVPGFRVSTAEGRSGLLSQVSTRFSLDMENDLADTGGDNRTLFARPNSRSRAGTWKFSWPQRNNWKLHLGDAQSTNLDDDILTLAKIMKSTKRVLRTLGETLNAGQFCFVCEPHDTVVLPAL